MMCAGRRLKGYISQSVASETGLARVPSPAFGLCNVWFYIITATPTPHPNSFAARCNRCFALQMRCVIGDETLPPTHLPIDTHTTHIVSDFSEF